MHLQKKKRNELRQKLKLANSLKSALPNYIMSNDMSCVSSSSGSPPLMASSYMSSPPMSADSTSVFLWSRINMIQGKQEELKRKQAELEYDQQQLLQCICNLTAMKENANPINFLYNVAANSDCGSDTCDSSSEADDHSSMYTPSLKKRRTIE